MTQSKRPNFRENLWFSDDHCSIEARLCLAVPGIAPMEKNRLRKGKPFRIAKRQSVDLEMVLYQEGGKPSGVRSSQPPRIKVEWCNEAQRCETRDQES